MPPFFSPAPAAKPAAFTPAPASAAKPTTVVRPTTAPELAPAPVQPTAAAPASGASRGAGAAAAAGASAQGGARGTMGSGGVDCWIHISPTSLLPTHDPHYGKSKLTKFVEKIRIEGIREPIKYVEYDGIKYVVIGYMLLGC